MRAPPPPRTRVAGWSSLPGRRAGLPLGLLAQRVRAAVLVVRDDAAARVHLPRLDAARAEYGREELRGELLALRDEGVPQRGQVPRLLCVAAFARVGARVSDGRAAELHHD